MNYSTDPRQRDQWIVSHRSLPHEADPQKPYAFFVEDERTESGQIVPVATLFLTNRHCPWHCVFCDLWKHTVPETVPVGAIPNQIRFALAELPSARQIKLYNNGSFFDSRAVPPEDYPAIAELMRPFERVIVESHPAFLRDSCLRFRDLLCGQLEVAIGLETAHPATLEKLNKHMTVDQFAKAAELLRGNTIALRTFLLVNPPFMENTKALAWVQSSVRFAFDCGSAVVCLIPTRPGNGALDALAREGLFTPPTICELELAAEAALALNRGCVLVDLWNLDQFSSCPHCLANRQARLQRMNHTQQMEPREICRFCGT